jgi:hypothetical protein
MLLLLVLDGIACVNGHFRCWAYETAVLLDCHREMSDEIPYNDYFDYYTPDYKVLFYSSSCLFLFVSSIFLLCLFFFFSAEVGMGSFFLNPFSHNRFSLLFFYFYDSYCSSASLDPNCDGEQKHQRVVGAHQKHDLAEPVYPSGRALSAVSRGGISCFPVCTCVTCVSSFFAHALLLVLPHLALSQRQGHLILSHTLSLSSLTLR